MKCRSWGSATGCDARGERRQNRAKTTRISHRPLRETQESDAKAASGEKLAKTGWSLHFLHRMLHFHMQGCAKTAERLQNAHLKASLCLKLPGVCRAAALGQSLLFAPWNRVAVRKP